MDARAGPSRSCELPAATGARPGLPLRNTANASTAKGEGRYFVEPKA